MRTALATACPSCGTENPPEAKFCIECGTAIARRPRAAARRPAAAAQRPPEERRQATVLFADLSGYTAVAERMDPEAVKALVDRALRRLGAGGRALRRHGRQVHRRQRDGACSARRSPTRTTPSAPSAPALAMQEAMDEINERIAADVGVSFALRVGINTGEVMAGAVGDGYTVIGDR